MLMTSNHVERLPFVDHVEVVLGQAHDLADAIHGLMTRDDVGKWESQEPASTDVENLMQWVVDYLDRLRFNASTEDGIDDEPQFDPWQLVDDGYEAWVFHMVDGQIVRLVTELQMVPTTNRDWVYGFDLDATTKTFVSVHMKHVVTLNRKTKGTGR